jgi:hypothetical protein
LHTVAPKEFEQGMTPNYILGGSYEINKWLLETFPNAFTIERIRNGILHAFSEGNIETAELLIKFKNLSKAEIMNILGYTEYRIQKWLPLISIKWLFDHEFPSECFRSETFVWRALDKGAFDELQYVHQMLNIRDQIVDILRQQDNTFEIYNTDRSPSYDQMVQWVHDEFGIGMKYMFNGEEAIMWEGDKMVSYKYNQE